MALSPLHTQTVPLATLGIAHSTRGRILSDRRSTFSGYLTSGILSGRRSTFSDISHPEFCPTDVPPSPDISHPAPDAGWEKRAIQFPQSDMSGSSNSAYPESICSQQFKFPGQLGLSNTRDSLDPFLPTIKKQTPIILTTKSPELSFSLCFILICFFYE